MTTVTRQQYGTEVDSTWTSGNTGTTELGLEYTTVSKEFDGSVTVGGVSIEDAFNVEELTIDSTTPGTGKVALAGEIASKQQQERCLVDGLDGTADPDDAANTDCLIVPGFEMDESTMEADLDTEHEEYVPMQENTTLATALGVDRLFLFPASKAVSFMGTLSGVSVLCDGRKSMVGYSVSGATDVAWVPVPWSWWKTLNETLRSDLLTALRLTDIGDTADESDLCQGITVTDGVLSGDVELSDKQRLFFAPNGDTDNVRQFGEVTVDGSLGVGGWMPWPGNTNYVAAVFAAVPKISMESVLGLAAVFVGIKGGVPQWMVTAVKTYGLTYANLVKAFSEWSNVQYAFTDSKKGYLVVNKGAYIKTGFTANQDSFASFEGIITTQKVSSTEAWHTLFAADVSVQSRAFGIWMNDSFNYNVLEYNNNYGQNANLASLNKSIYAEIDKNNISVKYTDDDSLIDSYTGTYGTFTTPCELGMFCNMRNGSILSDYDGFFEGKFRKAVMKDNGTIARLFVPFCRDGVYGVFDLVNMQFYTNANTSGSFTYSLE